MNERDRMEKEVAIHLRACFLNNAYEQAKKEWRSYHREGKEVYLRQARQLLNIKELAILSDNQELPKTTIELNPIDMAKAVQQNMLKDNFKRVIKEKRC